MDTVTVLAPETVSEVIVAEAEFQTLRGELAAARIRRERALYGAWRELPDPPAVARQLPRGISSKTVRSAVVRHAPPADFVQLALLVTEFA